MSPVDFLAALRTTNVARLAAWEDGTKADALFHAAELGGETGEVLNVVKKLHREAMGWRGSRSTVAKLAEEIGDVLICLDKLAAQYGIDIIEATAFKFNATSDDVGLPHKLTHPRWLCEHCGASQTATSPLCSPPFEVRPHAFNGKHPADILARDSRSKPDRATTAQTGVVHESGGARSAIAQGTGNE